MTISRRTTVVVAIAAVSVALPAGTPRAASSLAPAAGAAQRVAADSEAVVVAMGDLVCGTATPEWTPCLHAQTAALVGRLDPDALLLLGDVQYESGALQDFGAFFEPSFGRFRDRTFPVPGNHEYYTAGARGYFDYFNGVGVDSGRAGHRRRGYYSFDLGAWHIVALNSNCREIGGCGRNSPQGRWLRADLQASGAACTLAYWHNARFSSGAHGDDQEMRDVWQILYDRHADLIVQGHDHNYERFGPQDAAGRRDTLHGIRSFVVGTGGKGLGIFQRPRANSEIRNNDSIGVLRLFLRPGGFEWRFEPVPPYPLDDAGAGTCHGADASPGSPDEGR